MKLIELFTSNLIESVSITPILKKYPYGKNLYDYILQLFKGRLQFRQDTQIKDITSIIQKKKNSIKLDFDRDKFYIFLGPTSAILIIGDETVHTRFRRVIVDASTITEIPTTTNISKLFIKYYLGTDYKVLSISQDMEKYDSSSRDPLSRDGHYRRNKPFIDLIVTLANRSKPHLLKLINEIIDDVTSDIQTAKENNKWQFDNKLKMLQRIKSALETIKKFDRNTYQYIIPTEFQYSVTLAIIDTMEYYGIESRYPRGSQFGFDSIKDVAEMEFLSKLSYGNNSIFITFLRFLKSRIIAHIGTYR